MPHTPYATSPHLVELFLNDSRRTDRKANWYSVEKDFDNRYKLVKQWDDCRGNELTKGKPLDLYYRWNGT